MSGHSKWSKVKHQKAVTDVVKAAAFTKASRAITIAVGEGGGNPNPDMNFKLRLAIEKARAVNMPRENIERAIEKAKGQDGQALEQILYEAYGPGGVAFIIEAATDNRQRTVSEVKNALGQFGGSIASPGAVSFLFSRRGVVVVPRQEHTFDEILAVALEGGVEDAVEAGEEIELYSGDTTLIKLKDTIEKAGIPVHASELVYHPITTVTVSVETGKKIDELTQRLEDLPDIQRVFTNVV
jgi:YebC/PmpR family DNA-binding regulatory protein